MHLIHVWILASAVPPASLLAVDGRGPERWHSACYDPDMNEMHANRSWLPTDPDHRANR